MTSLLFSQTPGPPFNPAPISTGSLQIDLAIGGGILPGDIVDISGPMGSGKTLLCQHMAAAAQTLDHSCAWIDADHTLDAAFAWRCGVDFNRLAVLQPLDTEQAMDMLLSVAASGDVALVVVDSLTGLLSTSDLYPGKPHPDEEMISLAIRGLPQIQKRNGVAAIFTHLNPPTRGAPYHNLHLRFARLALPLHTSVRLRLGEPRPVSRMRKPIGQRTRVDARRLPFIPARSTPENFPPCSVEIDLDIMYNQGIVKTGELLDLGIQMGLILFRNGQFTFGDREMGPDRAAALDAIERPELAAVLEDTIRRMLLGNERSAR